MALDPIELAIDAGPAMNTTFADFVITAKSKIVSGSYVFEGMVGTGGTVGLGSQTVVGSVVFDPRTEVTYLDTDTGTLFVDSKGVTVLPDGSTDVPSVSDYTLYAIAHPSTTTLTQAQNEVITASYDPSFADTVNVTGTSITVNMRIENLTPGSDYVFSIHGYDVNENFISTLLVSSRTMTDASFDSITSNRKLTSADMIIRLTNPDSSVLLRAAVFPTENSATDVENQLIANTFTGNLYEELLPSGTNVVSFTYTDLTPGTAYRIVAITVDQVSNVVVVDNNAYFTTYSSPVIDIVQTDKTYNTLTAESTYAFQMDGVQVTTGIVPNDPTAISDFINAGTDPFGTIFTINYPTFGTYKSTFSATGLSPGVDYAAISKIVPNIEPTHYAHEVAVFRTASPPSITIGQTTVNYFDAIAPFSVIDTDDTVNVYAAIHSADTDPPHAAVSNLLDHGSAAYPNAIVAVGLPSYSNDISRYDLIPDSPYHITVVAVESSNNTLVNSKTTSFVTLPSPELTIGIHSFTDTVLTANVTSTGESHDLFVHVTPYIVGNEVIYDPNEIARIEESDSSTFIVAGSGSNVIYPEFQGLLEHTKYGLVAVVAQGGRHLVLNQKSMVVKTAALPDLTVNIDDVTYESVEFNVIGYDIDGPFRLLTAVSVADFTDSSAQAFADGGMTFTGHGVVDGTQHDFPNDIGTNSINFDYAPSNLEHNTHYVAVAVAVDEASGVVQWSQQPFVTEFRPEITYVSYGQSSFKVWADMQVVDRDGPTLTIKYNVYDTLIGLNEVVIKNDSTAYTTTSTGTGSRVVPIEIAGLNQNQTYHLGVVAISPDGTVSLAAIHTFTTDLQPTVSFVVDNVMARSLRTTITVDPNGVALYDAAVALFPYGTVVDDSLVVDIYAGTATGMIAHELIASQTAPLVGDSYFPSLAPGDRLTIVGTVNRNDGDNDVAYSTSNLYLRVEPDISAPGYTATTSTITSSISVVYNDPDIYRINDFDVIAAVVPAGYTDYSWIVPGATTNPVISGADTETFSNISVNSYASVFSSASLAASTDYELVVVASDTNLSERFVGVIPFTTRAAAAVTSTLVSVTEETATIDTTGALADGTFDMYVDIFQDTGSGQPESAWYDVAIMSGYVVGTDVSFVSAQHVFTGLDSQKDYIAVVVAVDNASGEQFRAFTALSTASHPPTINILQGSASVSSNGATLRLLIKDTDSQVTCFAKVFDLSNADPVNAAIVSQVVSYPDYTRVFRPSLTEIPFSITLTGLEPNTDYRLVSVAQDAVTGTNVYDFEDFLTLRESDYLDKVEYDNAYTLKWRRDATYTMPVRGVQVSNGKIGFKTRLDDVMGVTDVSISGNFDFNSYAGYTNNVVAGFDTSTVSLFDHSIGANPAAFTLSNQLLDMQTGVIQNTGRLIHADGVFDVQQDIIALRQMPYCTLNMYRLTPSTNVDRVRLYHEMTKGAGMDALKYDSVTVYHPGLQMSIPVFHGEADIRGSKHTVSAAVVYLFDTDSLSDVEHSGFNTFRNLDKAFDSHVLKNLSAGSTYSWATLSGQATSSDFPRPSQELPRLLMQTIGSLSRGSTNLYDVATRLRSDHVSSWSKIWQTSTTLTPKAGLTDDDEKQFYKAKRALRFAQYQLFSTVHDHGTAELNPLHLTSLDVDGNIFWNRELWMIPALLYFRPNAVKAMLENRFESLRVAKTLAAAQGHEGARFPYVGDVMAYGTAPYWDVVSASYVFNTALVGVAAWDYFRTTHNRDWLINKGYHMLSAVADYICSVASVSDTGVTSFSDILDVNGNRVTDPSFTLYICRSALKGAIESTYELRYPQRDAWIKTYHGIAMRFHTSPDPPEVIKHHTTANLNDEMNLLEPLMVLQPHYINDFLRGDLPRLITNDHDTILQNVAHYSAALSGAYADNPFNTLMRMSLYAQVNRSTGAHSATVHGLLQKAIDDAERDVWGAMSASSSSDHNDVTLSALFVLSFITSFAGMHIGGGVAQSGFYYVPFGVRAHATSYLPESWRGVVVTSGSGRTFNVINSSVYNP